jgi:hypothetical protein
MATNENGKLRIIEILVLTGLSINIALTGWTLVKVVDLSSRISVLEAIQNKESARLVKLEEDLSIEKIRSAVEDARLKIIGDLKSAK